MPATPKVHPVPLGIELVLNGGLPDADASELKSHVAQYARELCEDMGLSAGVTVSMSSAVTGSLQSPWISGIAIAGRPCRRCLWPRADFPATPSVRDLAELACLALYDSRQYLLTDDVVQGLAEEWHAAGWSSEGFSHFLHAFPRFNFSIRHARRAILTNTSANTSGAVSESEAALLFEQTMEEAADLEFGPAVSVSAEEYTEENRGRYVTVFKSLTKNLDDDMGLVCPDVRIGPAALGPGEFRIQVNELRLPVIRGPARGQILFTAGKAKGHYAMRLCEPRPPYWLFCAADSPDIAAERRWNVDPADYLRNFLGTTITGNAGSFLLSPVVFLMLRQVEERWLSAGVRAQFGELPEYPRWLTAILRRLLEERVSIADLAGILESLLSVRDLKKASGECSGAYHFSQLDSSPLPMPNGRPLSGLTVEDWAVAARLGVGSTDVVTGARGKDILAAMALPGGMEASLSAGSDDRMLSPFQAARLVRLLSSQPGEDVAIVVTQSMRTQIRRRLRIELPATPIIGSSEVSWAKLAAGQFRLGNKMLTVGAYFRAAEAFRRAIGLAQENADYPAYLAYALALQGDYASDPDRKNALYRQSKENYECAIRLNSRMSWYHQYLGSTLTRMKDWQGACSALSEAIALDGDRTNVAARRELALCQIRLGYFDEALTGLEILKASNPALAESRRDLAIAYAQHGQYAAAVDAAVELCSLTQGAKEPVQLLADLRDAKDKADQIRSEPLNAGILAAFGDILDKRLGLPDSAAECYRKAVTAAPEESQYSVSLGNVLYKQEKWGDAIAAWKQALTPNLKNHSLALNNIGTASEALGKSPETISEAMKYYAAAAEAGEKSFVPQYNLGSAHYRLGQFEEARSAYEKAKELGADFLPTRLHLGNCYYRLGQSDAAISEWEAAAKEPNMSYVEACYNLAIACWKNAGGKGNSGAVKYWEKAFESNPNLDVAEDNIDAVERWEAEGSDSSLVLPHLEIFDLIYTRGGDEPAASVTSRA